MTSPYKMIQEQETASFHPSISFRADPSSFQPKKPRKKAQPETESSTVKLLWPIYQNLILPWSRLHLPLSIIEIGMDQDAITQGRKEQLHAMNELAVSRGVKSTHHINTPDRERFRANLLTQAYGFGAPKKERIAYISLGLPASGKTSVIDEPIRKKIGGIIIDSDNISKMMPEYDNGKGYYTTVFEARSICDALIEKASDNQDNMIIDIPFAETEKVMGLCQKLKQKGYNIHLRLLDLPVKEALRRSVERYKETGRFIEPLLYQYTGDTTRHVYKEVVKLSSDRLSSYAAYSNNVPPGESARLIPKWSTIASMEGVE